MRSLAREIWISVVVIGLLAVLVCGVYPATVWVLGSALFPGKAAGSLVTYGKQAAGSALLAREFRGARYFHPRPSAAGGGYDDSRSGGTNWGPLSARSLASVRERVSTYRVENGLGAAALVPADAVTASASGLDPHISVQNALIQAVRVAEARGLTLDAVLSKIEKHTEGRVLGVLGRPRVNVLLLNLDLDGAP